MTQTPDFAELLGIPDIFEWFVFSTDEIGLHRKLPGLAVKRVKFIINASSVAPNCFGRDRIIKYLNIPESDNVDQSTLDMIELWLSELKSGSRILIHSDDPKKTREIFFMIGINHGIDLLNLIISMKTLHDACDEGSIN